MTPRSRHLMTQRCRALTIQRRGIAVLSRLVFAGLIVLLAAGCEAQEEGGVVPEATTLATPAEVSTAASVGAIEAPRPPTETSEFAGPLAPEAVQMTVDQVIASNVVRSAVPAETGSADVPPWAVVPDHVEVAFEGYVLPDTFHEPALRVYPVAQYQALSEPVGRVIDQLAALLAERPEPLPSQLPFLPPFNAGQMFTAQARYLDFQGGSGVRYLTQYSQALLPVNSNELFYTFQGLTDDGSYYVSALLPVAASILPDTNEISGDPEAFVAGFEAYIAATTAELDALPPSDFTPDLARLDALVGSIAIGTQ